MSNVAPNTRKHIRFSPDSTDYVQIDTDPDRAEFSFENVGLLVEESPIGGCSLVCLKSLNLKTGVVIRAKVGRLQPLKSEVVWVRSLDEQVERIGLKFLE